MYVLQFHHHNCALTIKIKLKRYGMFIVRSNKTIHMIRKLKSGKYRLYSKKKNPKTNKRRNLGTFDSLQAARKHEKDVQYFKRH